MRTRERRIMSGNWQKRAREEEKEGVIESRRKMNYEREVTTEGERIRGSSQEQGEKNFEQKME